MAQGDKVGCRSSDVDMGVTQAGHGNTSCGIQGDICGWFVWNPVTNRFYVTTVNTQALFWLQVTTGCI
ncbi:hypothetical protein GCM10023116_01020 [Kistimonas scapharcae]|uniref:Uncharacterized protein n=1 Tax=Kistimonas scapharcae TaxID=1036133 RepID=A0ABP8UYD1_9GAMM